MKVIWAKVLSLHLNSRKQETKLARKYKPYKISDKKNLIVDDNEEYINITGIMLENEGHIIK